ncbi:PIN domain-containing protein [Streptomyces sp. NBC_01102]|uniref:hypothetical protein n=1 Tax=Streptomyces sp. NBC_01102 TaxID=2903749 RepID=UPI003869994A|nr:PIN domain-containing protein [Streptomyces sp. NBC_01102]
MVLDTCVLFPNYLRDTLLRLAEAELYEPLWSADILEELRRNISARLDPARAKQLVEAMAGAFPGSAVAGYAALVPAMTTRRTAMCWRRPFVVKRMPSSHSM